MTRLVTVDVTSPGHLGVGVGRIDGRAVLVSGALPGETVRAEVTEERERFWRARVVDVLTPAPERVSPRCPAAAGDAGHEPTGCCDLSFVTAEGARALKTRVLADLLERMAGITWGGAVRSLPGGDVGWRTRAVLACSDGVVGLRPARSHEVVPRVDCAQLAPEIVAAAPSLTPPSDVTEVAIVVDAAGDVHAVGLRETTRPRSRGHRTDARRTPGRHASGREARARAQRRRATPPGHPVPLLGEPIAVRTAAGRPFAAPVDGFWQAHRAAADVYAATVAEFAGDVGGAGVWDLYGGVGALSAGLAGAARIDIVEWATGAVAAGEDAYADRPEVRLHAGRVEAVAPTLAAPDVVIADPPRAGAGRPGVAAAVAGEPSRIVHVGCDPAALARDLALYAGHGYRLQRLEAFDAFPLTHHVEALALLTRSVDEARGIGHP